MKKRNRLLRPMAAASCAVILLSTCLTFAGCAGKRTAKAGPSDALIQAWKETPSDIAGMTKWDKYNAGLAVAPGSDTDGDGLTDKQELETYHTDPKKVSSSGDLYSDLYKVQNGMDTATAHPYDGEVYFPHNSCPEVHLTAKSPTDFNAVVTPVAAEQIRGLQVYAAYRVYNYSGSFCVDLGDVLQREGLSLSDIAVYVSDGSDVTGYSYTVSGTALTLKNRFSPDRTYTVYCTEKNFLRFAVASMGLSDELDAITSLTEPSDEQEVTGSGLVLVSPILTELLRLPVYVQSERLLLSQDTQTLQDKVLAHCKAYFRFDNEYPVDLSVKTGIEIDSLYGLLQTYLPWFDATNVRHSQVGLQHVFFMYYSYEGKLAYEKKDEAAGLTGEVEDLPKSDTVSGFDLDIDTLPFGNFKTQESPNGSCAGISHLTAYVYNKKTFPATSAAAGWDSSISWNLEQDPENSTLRDPGLCDYKTAAFVADHSTDGLTLSQGLSYGEEEFAKMIAASYLEGNENAEFICYELFGGDFGAVTQDYSVIEAAMAYLDSGKILDVYLGMVDGSRHTVNLFDYHKDAGDANVVWFTVYDCNFPGNRTGSRKVSDTGFSLRVERRVAPNGGWTFAYDYFPLQDRSYGATSNSGISRNNMILILDEDRRLLND